MTLSTLLPVSRRWLVTPMAFALVLLCGCGCGSGSGGGGANVVPMGAGLVYTQTNASAGNAVSVYRRAAAGTLTLLNSVPSGGRGSGHGLASQGALALSSDGRWLFAVNAGSDDVSSFAVNGETLALADRVSSGGVQPISLAVFGSLLYVLNNGAGVSLTAFTIVSDGRMAAVPNSLRSLGASNSLPAQVQFSPDGRRIVVTERTTNLIKVFSVGVDGTISGPVQAVSAGSSPFGFAFDRSGGRLFVSEANSGLANQSSASSYNVATDGSLQAVSAAVATLQSDACWLVLSQDGRFAYTSNTGSGSVTAFGVGANGSLTRLNADGRAADTGAGSVPIDMAVSADGKFLYVLAVGIPAIHAYAINADGSLGSAGSIGGVPGSAVGLVAR